MGKEIRYPENKENKETTAQAIKVLKERLTHEDFIQIFQTGTLQSEKFEQEIKKCKNISQNT